MVSTKLVSTVAVMAQQLPVLRATGSDGRGLTWQ
jgi:hypothetical protein